MPYHNTYNTYRLCDGNKIVVRPIIGLGGGYVGKLILF